MSARRYLRPIGESSSDSVPWVVLDSNVFHGADWFLESTAGRLLRDEAAAGRLRIAVPEVVLIESEANHGREVRAEEGKLAAARAALEQLRSPQGGDRAPRRLRYRSDLDEILSRAEAEILPIPDTPHEQLIARAVERRRPFNDKGGGYRDALIWESVLGLLDRSAELVALISNDRGAFPQKRDKPKLAADLVRELRDRGHAGRVALHFQLKDFTATLATARELVHDWTRVLADNPDYARKLTDHLVEIAHHEATAVIGSANLVEPARDARFVSFANPRDLRVVEVWVSAEGSAILDVSLTLDYTQEFETPVRDPLSPDMAKSYTWTTMESSSTIELAFEVLQHDRDEPSHFAGRLVGWVDAMTLTSGGEWTGRAG